MLKKENNETGCCAKVRHKNQAKDNSHEMQDTAMNHQQESYCVFHDTNFWCFQVKSRSQIELLKIKK